MSLANAPNKLFFSLVLLQFIAPPPSVPLYVRLLQIKVWMQLGKITYTVNNIPTADIYTYRNNRLYKTSRQNNTTCSNICRKFFVSACRSYFTERIGLLCFIGSCNLYRQGYWTLQSLPSIPKHEASWCFVTFKTLTCKSLKFMISVRYNFQRIL